jgi:hypothetical protein
MHLGGSNVQCGSLACTDCAHPYVHSLPAHADAVQALQGLFDGAPDGQEQEFQAHEETQQVLLHDVAYFVAVIVSPPFCLRPGDSPAQAYSMLLAPTQAEAATNEGREMQGGAQEQSSSTWLPRMFTGLFTGAKQEEASAQQPVAERTHVQRPAQGQAFTTRLAGHAPAGMAAPASAAYRATPQPQVSECLTQRGTAAAALALRSSSAEVVDGLHTK